MNTKFTPSTIVISSFIATELIDTIIVHQDDGYQIDKLWYERKWYFLWLITKYYAKLTRNTVPPTQPYIEFKIGPIQDKK